MTDKTEGPKKNRAAGSTAGEVRENMKGSELSE